jgi:lauroyl/myristoyl acyltransferase
MTGAAIVPAFVVRNDMAYHAIFGKPAIVNDSDMLEKHAQEIIGIFEDCIKRYPDQWYNFVEI